MINIILNRAWFTAVGDPPSAETTFRPDCPSTPASPTPNFLEYSEITNDRISLASANLDRANATSGSWPAAMVELRVGLLLPHAAWLDTSISHDDTLRHAWCCAGGRGSGGSPKPRQPGRQLVEENAHDRRALRVSSVLQTAPPKSTPGSLHTDATMTLTQWHKDDVGVGRTEKARDHAPYSHRSTGT